MVNTNSFNAAQCGAKIEPWTTEGNINLCFIFLESGTNCNLHHK
ncbi:Protein of unknown function [Pyronema omphalodes CBS 100304]|uniref:Uncharacterized protein n=1 Tax=Pyronema omphalodes (strain CBS 100304) TaxID=1076935 RepID=U4L705_PYROM|nr:Protein of unknown function [Pyronema omphalodes CBS 100304]